MPGSSEWQGWNECNTAITEGQNYKEEGMGKAHEPSLTTRTTPPKSLKTRIFPLGRDQGAKPLS